MWPMLTAFASAVALWMAWSWWRQRQELRGLARLLDRERDALRTASQQLEQARIEAAAQRATLLNSMGEGVLLLDPDGRIQLVNHAFERLFQTRGDLRGRTVLEALQSHELHELVEQTRRQERILGAAFERRGVEPRHLLVNAAAIPNDPSLGLILVFHDQTEARQLENSRKEFVANVSHELRTPLSLIKGYVETLIDGAKDDPQLALRFLQTIAKHTDRLTYLIEDLLTLSRLDAASVALNLQDTPLRDLAARVLDDLGTRAVARQMTLDNQVPGELTARADADRVQQVLFNLVDNALKYAPGGGRVTLAGRTAGEDFVELSVSDEGPGIPPGMQERIFERFFRLDQARSREQGGTGLGLAIVKHLVQAHGGEVRVESAPGQGTTFRFTLRRV